MTVLTTPPVPLPVAVEIVPNLFVGTREDAEALGDCVPENWACISVTEYRSRYKRSEELPHEPDGSLDLPFMTDLPDGWRADPHKLDLISEVIWWKLQIGKKVLVHCIHGQERSPLAMSWYLVWAGNAHTIDSAYAEVSRLHPRTERRDKWLRGSVPNPQNLEIRALLKAAGNFAGSSPAHQDTASEELRAAAFLWGRLQGRSQER